MATAREYLENFLHPEETTASDALAYIVQVCQDLGLPLFLAFDPKEYLMPQEDGSLLRVEGQEGYRLQIDGEGFRDEEDGEVYYQDFESLVLSGLNLLQYVLEGVVAAENQEGTK